MGVAIGALFHNPNSTVTLQVHIRIYTHKTRIIRMKTLIPFSRSRGQGGILSHVLKPLHWFFDLYRYSRAHRFVILRRVHYIKMEFICVLCFWLTDV